jgi:hypothetical protein
MKMVQLPVADLFEAGVSISVSAQPERGGGDIYQLAATHPTRPGVVIRRPFEAPQGCRFEQLQDRGVWMNYLPETWRQIVTALWVSGADAYEEVETFEAVPVGIGEIRADKSRSAADWKPREALIELLRRIDSGEYPDMDALILCWREKTKKGIIGSFYSASSPDIHTTLGILARAEWAIQEGATGQTVE